MGTLRILSTLGDTAYRWDQVAASRGDVDAQEAVRQAERIFELERGKGGTALHTTATTTARVLYRFNPDAEQIVIVPRIAGE